MIKEYKKEVFEFIISIISLVLMFDVLGFLWWATSGQMPVDNFHIGVITKSIINLIF